MEGGGSERQMLNLISRLDRDRFQSELYLLYASGALLPEVPTDVAVDAFWNRHEVPSWNWPGKIHRMQVQDLRRKVKSGNVDLVYDRLFHMSMLTGPACRGSKIARVSTIVSPPSHDLPHAERRLLWLKRRLLAFSYRTADRLMAVSNATAKDASDFYKIPIEKFTVLSSPIDIERLDRLSQKKWNGSSLIPDRKQIISIGRLSDEKGQLYLLQAVALILRRHQLPIHLHIVGDGPQRATIQRQAEHLGISHYVTFHGHIPNPYSLLAQCHLLCLPSLYEGLPNVVLEAMACKIPIVATHASGSLVELVTNVLKNRLVPPANAEQLSDAILSRFNDEGPWLANLDQGREYIEKNHSLPNWMEKIQGIFEDTIERKRGS